MARGAAGLDRPAVDSMSNSIQRRSAATATRAWGSDRSDPVQDIKAAALGPPQVVASAREGTPRTSTKVSDSTESDFRGRSIGFSHYP